MTISLVEGPEGIDGPGPAARRDGPADDDRDRRLARHHPGVGTQPEQVALARLDEVREQGERVAAGADLAVDAPQVVHLSRRGPGRRGDEERHGVHQSQQPLAAPRREVGLLTDEVGDQRRHGQHRQPSAVDADQASFEEGAQPPGQVGPGRAEGGGDVVEWSAGERQQLVVVAFLVGAEPQRGEHGRRRTTGPGGRRSHSWHVSASGTS
jgi:hypothetical protein